jgi:hypothetical protein
MFALAAAALGLLTPQADAAVPSHGRGWELASVNPPSSSRVPGLWPLSDDGTQFLIATVGPPLGTQSGAAFGFASAVRGPSGWTNAPFGVPYEAEFDGEIGVISALAPIFAVGFGEAMLWYAGVPLTPGAPPEGDLSLYRQFPGKSLEFVSKTGTGVTFVNGGFREISSDGDWVVFTSEEPLLPGDASRTQGQSIYAWDGVGGLQLVDVDSGGNLLENCGSRISQANGMDVFNDRVFFTTSSACGSPEKVYVADLDAGTTTEISASLCTRLDCNAPADVKFAGALANGRFVYMLTTQQLVDGDTDELRDLYRYNADTGALALLSGALSPEYGDVVGDRVYPSESGGRVYFRTLLNDSSVGWENRKEAIFLVDDSGLHLATEARIDPPIEFQLSDTGARALFVTSTPLVAGDTDSQSDAYLYDADTGNLTWVSKGPGTGNAELPVRIEPSSPLSRWEFQYGNLPRYRAMDATGDRVFLQTAESLLPEDTNNEPDVYEVWNGQLGLISPGNQPLRSDFGGVSRDGQSVVFGTNAALVPRDNDGESRDLYVARIGGGFPEPPPGGPGCDNVTCPIPLDERLATSNPPTVRRSGGKPAGLRVTEVGAKAKKGAITVVASVPGPGLVSGSIATVKKGKKTILATGSKRAKQAGKVELKLKLTKSARRSTATVLNGQLTLKQGSSKVSQTVKVSLR